VNVRLEEMWKGAIVSCESQFRHLTGGTERPMKTTIR
jgi:hypothetical protein